MKRVLVVAASLIAVAGLLVGLDRGAAWLVARNTADQLAATYQITPAPTVEFAGFPFLDQLVTQRFDRVSVDAPVMTLDSEGTRLTLRDVRFDLVDVRGSNPSVAGRLDGVGVLDWAGVGELAGQPVRHAGGDRIEITHTADIFGASVTARISGRPELGPDGNSLRLADAEIDIAGYQLPGDLATELLNRFAGDIPLQLPLGLRLQRIDVTEAGLVATVTGTDVALL